MADETVPSDDAPPESVPDAAPAERASGPGWGLLACGGLLVALIAGLSALRLQPPEPLGLDAPADAFSADRSLATLARLLGDGEPHPVGSAANLRVRQVLIDELRRRDYHPELQETFAFATRYPATAWVGNVLTRLEGREPGRATLLVAHYDSVGAGSGAADDGAGVATLLEVARALKEGPTPKHPVLFLFSDGEEAGLLGAEAFVAEHPWMREVEVVLNVEARGSRGPSLMFETGRDDAGLIELFQELPHPIGTSGFATIYDLMPNNTDFTPFKEAGLRGLNFAFIGGIEHYHTPQDDLAHLSAASVQHHGENLLALTRALAAGRLEAERAGKAVFCDLLGGAVLAWSAGSAPSMAFALLVFVLGVSVRPVWLRLGARSALLGGAAGLVGLVLALVAGCAAGSALLQGVAGSGALPAPWVADPGPAVVACSAATLAGVLLVAWPLGRLADFWCVWAGTWLGWSLAALAVANTLPGFSYLFLLPGLAAVVGGACGVPLAERSPAAGVALAGLLPLGAAAVLIVPTCLLLGDGLGLLLPGLAVAPLAFALALLASAGLPLLAARELRGRGLLIGVLAALALGAALVAAAQPPYTPEHPRRVALAFQQDDAHGARWLAMTGDDERPEFLAPSPLAQHDLDLRFSDHTERAFPWSGGWGRGFSAPAAPLAQPGPQLAEPRTEDIPGGRRIQGVLRSPRGARQATLVFPADAPVVAVTLQGRRRTRAELRARRGYVVLRCNALPPGGLQVELELAGHAPLELHLLDLSDGLPDASGPRLSEARRAGACVATHMGDLTVFSRRQDL